MDHPWLLFVYFRSFQPQFYRKIVDLNEIQTHIVVVEGEYVDNLTTTQSDLVLKVIKLWSLIDLPKTTLYLLKLPIGTWIA